MRDLDHAQALADVAYQTDGSIWLGEWHTHVNGPVTPSRYDLRTYRGLLDDEDLRFESLVSLIITTETADWCNVVLHGWIITHSSRGRVRRLAVTSADVGPPKDVP